MEESAHPESEESTSALREWVYYIWGHMVILCTSPHGAFDQDQL
jgi:hypothetical protein